MERLRRIWHNIRYRCYTPTCPFYDRYGGRGIKLYEPWNDYEVFKQWSLEHGYREGLCIDRIDNDGDYEPTNCQWITIGENTAKANALYVRRKPNSGKLYYGKSPSGEIYYFDNASQFVRDNPHLGLNAGCIRAVARGEKKSHYNWSFGYVD